MFGGSGIRRRSVGIISIGVLVWAAACGGETRAASTTTTTEQAASIPATTAGAAVPPSSKKAAPVEATTAKPAAVSSSTTVVKPSSTTPASTDSTAPATVALPASSAAPAPPTTSAAALAPSFVLPHAGTGHDENLDVFRGLGTWLDVFEWAPSVAKGPTSTPSDVDTMAAEGVDTLYIQTARTNGTTDITDESVLRDYIDRAHGHGIKVVGWYLPTHSDPNRDLRRLLAMTKLPIDGIGVDIEGTDVADIAVRNSRLLELSHQLRDAVGASMPIVAIVFSPLALVELKPTVWPGFPWKEVDAIYDAWMPMGYWTFRRDETPEWDDGERYTAKNFELLRALTGRADVAIHTIGGLSEDLLDGQAAAMVAASKAYGGLGASLYSFTGTNSGAWAELAPLQN